MMLNMWMRVTAVLCAKFQNDSSATKKFLASLSSWEFSLSTFSNYHHGHQRIDGDNILNDTEEVCVYIYIFYLPQVSP